MYKLFVTGAIGSGKTYFSNYISRKTGVPVTSLDEIFFDLKSKELRKEQDSKIRDERLLNTTKDDYSIYEGWHFGNWLIPMYKILDAVIIVDTLLDERILRINKRFENRKMGHEIDPYPSAGTDHLNNLIKWTKLWDEKKVLDEIRLFSKNELKLFNISDVEQIDAVLLENLPNKAMHWSRPL